MSNNLFKIPFGFYVENNQLVSKRTQIEQLLNGMNDSAEENAALDTEQGDKIASNTELINQEVERSTSADEQFETALEQEISERKRMGGILNTKISDLEENVKSLVEETDKAFDVVADELRAKDELLDAKDGELTNSISVLSSNLSSEISARKAADETLSQAISLNTEEVESLIENVNTLSASVETRLDSVEAFETRISTNEKAIGVLTNDLAEEISTRESADVVLTEKVNALSEAAQKISDVVKEEVARATAAEAELEETKVPWTELGEGRKAIVLENHDMLLGKDVDGSAANIAMISKWNVVDLGTAKLPINLNTPSGVRPTVQEDRQSGEEAHQMAYLSDVEDANSSLQSVIDEEVARAKAAEKVNADAIIAEQDRADKVETALDERIDSVVKTMSTQYEAVQSTITILNSTDNALKSRIDLVEASVNNLKNSGIELKSISELEYTLYVDGIANGTISIPKDNFLNDVYLTDGDMLHFVFSVGEKQADIEVNIAKYIDIYTAGNGLSVVDNKFSLVISETSEGFLTVSENGLSLNGVANAISSAVAAEQERAIVTEQTNASAISEEVARARAAEEVNASAISIETERARGEEEKLFTRMAAVENFETRIKANEEKITALTSDLSAEIVRAESVEGGLQSSIDALDLRVSANETNIVDLESDLDAAVVEEASAREAKDNELDAKVTTALTAINAEIDRAEQAEKDLYGNIVAEYNRAVAAEETKVPWTELGDNRKSIVLGNHDLLLGTTTKGVTANIGMISKWDVVDLGTASLPINLNTPSGVRPTVQEAGKSGEEAYEIAYYSDVKEVKDKVDAISFEGYATEQWVEDKNYLSEVPAEYVTKTQLDTATVDKVTISTMNSLLNDLESKIPTVPTKVSEFENDIHYLTEHQDISNLVTKEEIEDVVRYSEGDGKKVIMLDNADLIMGKVNPDSEIQPYPSASALTLLQLNKWNIVDLGSPKTIVNINVHEGYRPTVQESNQSGEEAHQIAYLEDIDELKAMIAELQGKVKEFESKVYTNGQLIDKISSMNEGDVVDIVLLSDMTVSEASGLVVPTNSTLNINLNGQTLAFTANDIFLRVNGTLNIGGGNFEGSGYVASANQGGVINVTEGTYTSNVTTFQANAGTVNVYGGYFETTSEKYGSRYTLNHIDKNKYVGNISVYGGTFVNYNPSESASENPVMNFVADGYGVISSIDGDNTLYKVVEQKEVSNGEDFVSLISELGDGEDAIITLSDDLTVESSSEQIIINGNVVLDLGGKTINFDSDDILFRVNGSLEISNGVVNSNGYVASANEGSSIKVLNGTYNADVTAFQANGGSVVIEDGYFSACNETYGCKYTLNHIDAMKNVGKIEVYGGTFVNYDPSNSASENPVMDFVADGYASVQSTNEEGETVYTVMKQTSVSSINDVAALISSLEDGGNASIVLEGDLVYESATPLYIGENNSINLDLNGHTFTNKVSGRAALINYGTMIISNGSIVNGDQTAQASAAINNYGTMVIESGNFGSSEQRGAAVENKGTLTINGGTFTALEKGTDNSNGWAYVFINNGDENSVMTINDATVDCNAHGVFAADSGTINVNGGTYKLGNGELETYYMSYAYNGTINLNAGSFIWIKGKSVSSATAIEGSGSINIGSKAVINW